MKNWRDATHTSEKHDDDANYFNNSGIEEYDKGNYEEAEKWYKKAIDADPNFKWAYYNLGLVYEAYKQYQEAIEWYDKAIAIDYEYANAHNGKGVCYYALNNYKSAREEYEKATAIDPNLVYPHYNLGLIAEKEKDWENAKNYYKKAIEVDPYYGNAYNNLGIIYYEQDNYDEALKYYNKAIEVTPNMVYPYYNIGLIAERREKWTEAKKWYNKALEIDSTYQNAIDGLDFVNERMTEGDDAFLTSEDNVFTDDKIKDKSSAKETGFEKYGRNLNEQAREEKLIHPVGRDKEILSVLEILNKRIKNNPVLVGHAGVGKTAIVEGIALLIEQGKVPEMFKNRLIVEVNMGSLLAGTTYRGDLEKRMKSIIQEVKENPNIIVFIDEIHTILGAGRVEGGNLDVAQMLKPVLARGEFPCIGATTFDEYRKYIESDAALERRFYPVRVDELTPEGSLDVLKALRPKIEKHYNLKVNDENLELVIELARQHIRKRYFPDKAIDILEKSASRCSLKGEKTIHSTVIKDIVGEMVGIEFLDTDMALAERLLGLEDYLRQEVVGQEDAIQRVSDLVRMAKRRLDLKPERPDGVFFFTGPSGVGKTELAKQLCQYLYGSLKKLIRLDMNEFSESHSVSKLIGSPPGYVGYDDVPFLTANIEENPASVLLLDEFEKCHPDVMKIFLQVFDEGKLKDAKGKTIYFSDATIIMTSNAVQEINKSMGFGTGANNYDVSVEQIIRELNKKHGFPIEFLNRIDEIILFNPLGADQIKEIVQTKIVKQVINRFKEHKIKINFDQSIIDRVIEIGYSPEFGARNLERTFEKLVVRSLSNYILKNRITEGGELEVKLSGDEVVIEK